MDTTNGGDLKMLSQEPKNPANLPPSLLRNILPTRSNHPKGYRIAFLCARLQHNPLRDEAYVAIERTGNRFSYLRFGRFRVKPGMKEKKRFRANGHPIVAEVDTESHPSGYAGFSSLQGWALKSRELWEMNSIPQCMINHLCVTAYLLCLLWFKQRSYPRFYNSVDEPVILNRLF